VAQDWLDRLGVGDVAHHRVRSLSGGQSQRVALARALATEPRLLLLDEPMAALDVTQRAVVRQLLRDHLGGSGTSCVLVTHDPLDASALADALVIVDDGRVVQHGTSADVARRPASTWVARMMGVNLLTGRVRDGRYDLGAGIVVPVTGVPAGEQRAVLAPRDVVVTPYGSGEPPAAVADTGAVVRWSTRLVTLQPTGDRVVLGLEYPTDLMADVPVRRPDGGRWREGMHVWAAVDPSDVQFFGPGRV
jgi:molybdate transport system ATP-binding protein